MSQQEEKGKPLLSWLIEEALRPVIDYVKNLSQEEAKRLAEKIRDEYPRAIKIFEQAHRSVNWELLKTFISNYINEGSRVGQDLDRLIREGKYVEAILEALFSLITAPFTLIQDVVYILNRTIYQMFMPQGRLTFKDALTYVDKYTTILGDMYVFTLFVRLFAAFVSAMFGFTPGIAHAMRIVSYAVGDFLISFAWLYGIGWLSWVSLSPVFFASIAQPIQAELRRRTTPETLTAVQTRTALYLGLINLSEYLERMRSLGYSEDEAILFFKVAERLPTFAQLRTLLAVQRFTDEQVKTFLKAMRYRPDLIDDLLTLMHYQIIESELRQLRYEAIDHYTRGLLTEADLNNWLVFTKVTEEEAKLLTQLARWRREQRWMDEKIAYCRDQYLNDKIDENELEACISEIVKDPEVAEIVYMDIVRRKKPELEALRVLRLETRKALLEKRIENLKKRIKYLEKLLEEEREICLAQAEIIKARLAVASPKRKPVYEAQLRKLQEQCEKRFIRIQQSIENLRDRVEMYEIELEAIKRRLALAM